MKPLTKRGRKFRFRASARRIDVYFHVRRTNGSIGILSKI